MTGVDITQTGRFLSVETVLGEDKLILTAFEGEERLSRPFLYRLEMASADDAIAAERILGTKVTIHIARDGGEPRCFNGIVKRFAAGPMWNRDYRCYYAEVVPWLWFLTRRVDCRIFEKLSTLDIIKKVFQEHGSGRFETVGSISTPEREYCVQYRESDFDFVSRLLEEEGIFYFFKHKPNEHTLVLANARSAYVKCEDGEAVQFGQHVSTWRSSFEFLSGRWEQQDYDYEKPAIVKAMTNTLLKTPDAQKYPIFDYPGGFIDSTRGAALTKIRMEEEEAGYAVSEGRGIVRAFSPGVKFTLKNDETESENGSYVITSVRHVASDRTHFAGDGSPPQYHNDFTCIPESVTYRPPRVTPKPVVRGPQTAIVTDGPENSNYNDKYGRVRVKFHWSSERGSPDRDRQSCWLRVAQLWAGRKWGAFFLPRIDMEVIVDFLEGDPDRPIVVGCVYNGDKLPPYPSNKAQSGIKTRSWGGGEADFNELRFGDEKGKEHIYFHAQKDFERVVENDDSLEVSGNQTAKIKKNQTVTVEQKSSLEAKNSIELKVGQNSITIDQSGITLKGMMIKVEAQNLAEVKGVMVQVNGTGQLVLKGALTMIN